MGRDQHLAGGCGFLLTVCHAQSERKYMRACWLFFYHAREKKDSSRAYRSSWSRTSPADSLSGLFVVVIFLNEGSETPRLTKYGTHCWQQSLSWFVCQHLTLKHWNDHLMFSQGDISEIYSVYIQTNRPRSSPKGDKTEAAALIMSVNQKEIQLQKSTVERVHTSVGLFMF